MKTLVDAELPSVWERFDQELFLALNPPFPPVKLLKFEGSETGNEVALELNFFLFKQKWVSIITNHSVSETAIEFTDEGERLPFFLIAWKHQHRLERTEKGTYIIDNIQYRAPMGLSWLLYPALWLQFLYRKPIYKRYFRK